MVDTTANGRFVPNITNKCSRTYCTHIYEEFELDENSTCRKFRQVRKEGNREVSQEMTYYNLDMIISLGYRVKSRMATRTCKCTAMIDI